MEDNTIDPVSIVVLESNTQVPSVTSTNSTKVMSERRGGAGMNMCAHAHTEARGRHGMSDSITFYLLPLTQDLFSMNLQLGRWPSDPSNLVSPHTHTPHCAEVTGAHSHTKIFFINVEICTQFLMLEQQGFALTH